MPQLPQVCAEAKPRRQIVVQGKVVAEEGRPEDWYPEDWETPLVFIEKDASRAQKEFLRRLRDE